VLNLDAQIGIHADALRIRSQRAELIANNLANADTPNFKARDVDFRAALAASGYAGATGGVALSTTQGGHLGGPSAVEGADPALRYRQPLAPSLDGNTVDVQVEQASFGENAVRYQATLTFINSKLRGLMTAITGQ
jgi:flagellar basal-body rod protein FlgB